MKTEFTVSVEYPAEHFFTDMRDFDNRPEGVIDRELDKAKLPEIGGSGCGFGVRDFSIYGLKSMDAVYAAKRIIRKVFKNRNISGYSTSHRKDTD